MKELVRAALDAVPDLARRLNPQQMAQCVQVMECLLEANQRLNLTALREPATAVEKHLLDALLPLTLTAASATGQALDVGTGGGFPGLPLAIALPGLSWTLLDATQKKLAHVQATAHMLGLENVAVCHARAEQAAHGPQREAYALVTARAVAPMAALAQYTLPFVAVGGQAWFYKGPEAAAEMAAAGDIFKKLGAAPPRLLPYRLPGGDGRTLVVVQKTRHTPAEYPQGNAVIRKR